MKALIFLLLAPAWSAPVSDNDDNLKLHNHTGPYRSGKDFTSNEFVMGKIDVDGTVTAEQVSIGHDIRINIDHGMDHTGAAVIDGGWSGWSVSSECSASCGAATRKWARTCTNPAPANEGKACEGNNEETRSCDRPLCECTVGIATSDDCFCKSPTSNSGDVCTATQTCATDGTCVAVCAADEVNPEACFCQNAGGGEVCFAGQACNFEKSCLDVCNPKPYPILADCFCKNTNDGGVPCPRDSKCDDGVCLPPVVEHPCTFDDRKLDPPQPVPQGQNSPYDSSERFRWTDNKVPYYYGNENTSQHDKNFIRDVMDIMEDETCFKFELITQDDYDYKRKHCLEIFITDNVACRDSRAGSVFEVERTGRLQLFLSSRVTKSDGTDCGKMGLIIHELMHVLGVAHTHRRGDRDTYLKVEMSNVDQNYKNNFEMCPVDVCTLYDAIPYDCGSIMHYGTHAFSSNTFATMIPNTTKCELFKSSNLEFISQASDVEAKDWELLKIIGYERCPVSMRKRSVQEIATVRGKIILPAGLDFTFPEDSRVHISCADISKLRSTILGSVVVDVSNKSSQEDIHYEMEADLSKSKDISMSSTINVGWKSDPIGDEWIRKGDFVNDIRHHLYVTQDTSEYQMDIAVVHYN